MSPRLQKLLKVSLTLLLLALVLPRIDYRALGHAFGALNLLEVLTLALLACLQQVLLTKRFAAILTYFEASLGLESTNRLLALLLDQQVGTAYNIVLPSTVGGDVMRALRAQERVSGPSSARSAVVWSAVLLDRIVGLLALVIVPLLGLLLGAGPKSGVLLQTTLAIVLVLLPLMLFAGRLFFVLARLTKNRSARLYKLSNEVGQVLESTSWAVRLQALGWSLAYQLSVNAFFHVAAAAFSIPLAAALPAIWIGIPLVFVLSTLPVTIGGLGLRESLFVGLLGLCGVAAAEALALALVWSVQGLLTAGIGLVTLWCERLPGRAASAE
ncbi:MAG: hypothetical protein JWN04_1485 [Myxococcaceae bacterium]|nr:hypothetical protein [Myxococcaceae bacterium]